MKQAFKRQQQPIFWSTWQNTKRKKGLVVFFKKKKKDDWTRVRLIGIAAFSNWL